MFDIFGPEQLIQGNPAGCKDWILTVPKEVFV